MKICQISDTHLGLTSPQTLRKLVRKLSQEAFDVLVHCGDYSGRMQAASPVESTIKLLREYLPDTDIVSVLGNHDYWCGEYPSTSQYFDNLTSIKETFTTYNVHWLDTNSYYQHKDYPDIYLVGTTGWYSANVPDTNDARYLPRFIEEDNIHEHLRKRADSALGRQLEALDKTYNKNIDTVVFVSHFPVRETRALDYKFKAYGGSTGIGKMLQDNYNCRYFLNGHAHQLHNLSTNTEGRYESGSDYYHPKYQIIEVI